MKLEVDIPEGKYCGSCMFVAKYGAFQCNYLEYFDDYTDELKQEDAEDGLELIKHPDCPSLK